MAALKIWQDILWSHDVHGGLGSRSMIFRGNILVNDTQRKEDGLIHCDLLKPHGMSTQAAISDLLIYEEETVLSQKTISWDPRWGLPEDGSRYFLMNVADGDFAPYDYMVDGDTLPVPVTTNNCGPIRILEMYAGGIGGWHGAATLLKDFHDFDAQVIGIEKDIHAVMSYSISHRATILDGYGGMLPIDALTQRDDDCVIHANIHSNSWIRAVAQWAPELIAISSPCPPWSRAAGQEGMTVPDGFSLSETLASVKFLEPRFLLIEQVGGFASHDHRDLILQQIRWAGFHLQWGRVIDLQSICPVKRTRWLGLAIKVGDPVAVPRPFKCWDPSPPTGPVAFDAVFPDAWTNIPELQISPKAMNMASDVSLLPPNKRQKVAPADVFSSRCYSGKDIIPTFMAAYTNQHNLNPKLLEEKGLMTHFVKLSEDQAARMWHPLEALILHAPYKHFWIPHDWITAWRHIGNHISVPHALLLLVNALAQLPSRCTVPTIDEALHTLMTHRISASKVKLHQHDLGLFATVAADSVPPPFDAISEFLSQLDMQQLPRGAEWHPVRGFFVPVSPTHPIAEVTEDDIPENPVVLLSPLTVLDSSTEEESIEATAPFVPFMQGVIHGPEQPVSFWFAADVPMDIIAEVWDDNICVKQTNEPPPPGVAKEFQLNDRPLRINEDSQACVIFHEGNLTILPPTRAMFDHHEASYGVELEDQFGRSPLLKFDSFFAFRAKPVSRTWSPELPMAHFVVAAFPACQIRSHFCNLELELIISGPPAPRNTMVQFWTTLISSTELGEIGLRIAIQESSESTRVIFKHLHNHAAFPVPALRILLAVYAFRYLMQPLHTSEDDARLFYIKWLGRYLWKGHLQDSLTIQTISTHLVIATIPTHGTENHLGFRVIHTGKLRPPHLTLIDCPSSLRVSEQKHVSTLHMILGMTGGGPGTGSKGAHRIQIKNSVASTLLQEGHDLQWVSQSVDKLVDAASVRLVAPLTSMPPGNGRLQAIYQMMRQNQIDIPPCNSKLTSQVALQQKHKKRAPIMPCPDDYTVSPGSLLYADGSPAQQTKEIHPHQRGFCLTTMEAAAPWLQAAETVSSDELALIVVGTVGVDTQLPVSTHTLPCTDQQQRQVLLAVTVIQLGEKHVTVKQWANQQVATDNTTMMAITLWRDELEDHWMSLSSNPFGHIRKILGPHQDAVVSMWGKSFRKNKGACQPKDASSLQIHCTLKDDALKPVLQEGGYNHLWFTPKSNEGKPHSDYKLIWLAPEVTLQETKVIGAKLSSFYGISRGANRYAIRVASSSFAASWKLIHPGSEPPEQVAAEFLYKLESLPFGTTSNMLNQWSTHAGFKMKAIRALGPRCWLIGTPKELPVQQYAFNGAPILINPVKPRYDRLDPIVAGPKPSLSTQALPALASDPWAPFFSARSGISNTAKPTAPAQPGPTEIKLQEQDSKLQDMASSLAAMQANQAEQQQHIASLKEDIHKREQKVLGHIDGQIQHLRNEMDQSFSQALKQHSQHFDDNLAEIKQLLLANQKRKTPADGDEEM
eukprot:Skav215955  [mRNA]  locus=scaffold226:965212:969801:+ [translate_table: standard]